MEMNYGAVKRAQKQFGPEAVQKLQRFISAPKLLALTELLRLRHFNRDTLRLLRDLDKHLKRLNTEERDSHDGQIQEGVTDEELESIRSEADLFILNNKRSTTQIQPWLVNFTRLLRDCQLQQGLESRVDELLRKDQWAHMESEIVATAQRKFDELSNSFTDITKLRRALNKFSKGADKDLNIRGEILTAFEPFHDELRRRVLSGVISVVDTRCRSTLRDAICDALCGENRVFTSSANATPSRKRTWITKRISDEWESTGIVRDTIESNIASLDDMKREVDMLLRRHFSRVVGEKLRPTLTVAGLVNVFKDIIRDWVKFGPVLSCLRVKFRDSIPSICNAVATGILRKPHPVKDALAYFKKDRQNQCIVRVSLQMSKVPSQKMKQALEEMWDNLSTEDREIYEKKAERHRDTQRRAPALRKDPALYEFVLGFCSTISDRHGTRSIRRLHGCHSCRIYAKFDAHSLVCR
jgi:hypothetical protein